MDEQIPLGPSGDALSYPQEVIWRWEATRNARPPQL
jgi:hypothetical protein